MSYFGILPSSSSDYPQPIRPRASSGTTSRQHRLPSLNTLESIYLPQKHTSPALSSNPYSSAATTYRPNYHSSYSSSSSSRPRRRSRAVYPAIMSPPIARVTLFKVSDPANIDAILATYVGLKEEALKDSKPYILSAKASRTHADPRNQGYTICARTSFASLEDMQYYDTQCSRHEKIKVVAKPLIEGILTVYTDDNE